MLYLFPVFRIEPEVLALKQNKVKHVSELERWLINSEYLLLLKMVQTEMSASVWVAHSHEYITPALGDTTQSSHGQHLHTRGIPSHT